MPGAYVDAVGGMKTSPILAAFAPGRTAGVGVVFPAGASVMAPDAQLCAALTTSPYDLELTS